jgi:ethanolamine utilization protein EutM
LIKCSLGIIETVGLVAAIEAADSALKTANVELVGYEISNGDGLVTVKIQGDVSAVSTAIKAARMSAGNVNTVFSTTIIARPSEGIENMIFTCDTVGIEKLNYSHGKEDNEVKNLKINEELLNENPLIEVEIEEIEEATCNLCMDPKCPRKKGENRNICIHNN